MRLLMRNRRRAIVAGVEEGGGHARVGREAIGIGSRVLANTVVVGDGVPAQLPARLPCILRMLHVLPARLLPARLLPAWLLPARLLPVRLLPARLLPARFAVMCARLRLVAVQAVKSKRLMCRAIIILAG